jgi:adenine-specific DNA-methyltransferase
LNPLELISETYVEPPQTIKYMGSKRKIAPYILQMIDGIGATTVFDGFSGSTFVSQYLANRGFIVHSSDYATWSEVMGKCFLVSEGEPSYYKDLINHLNNLPAKSGWFTEKYGGNPENTSGKRPWQIQNTMKLDAIRDEIDVISKNEYDKEVLLTALILAMDKVDNTLGHYVAYLGKWSPRSYNLMQLQVPKFSLNRGKHTVSTGDIFSTVIGNTAEIAYFDPPYGSNNELMPPSRVRYNSYYHIWKSVILNDKPELFGVNNRREDSRDESSSIFEEYRQDENGNYLAINAIAKLISVTENPHIIFSYSSGGRATKHQLMDIFNTHSKSVNIVEISHNQNVMKNMASTKEFLREESEAHKEYLVHLIKK